MSILQKLSQLQLPVKPSQPASPRWIIANEELKFCWETDEEFGSVIRVRHELGSGSYGRVYKATYKHQHVAVKEIDIVPSQKEKQIASFEKEIESAIDFWEVPNIVRCLGGSIKKNQKKEVLRIVFEFLDARLDEELYYRDFTEKERRKVVSDVARGLTFLHKSLITHRDLKPENVMLHKGMGCWKLIDFGTATSKSSILEVTKKTGAGRGTVGYMAPELYTETGGNHKVDVFAFATTSWSVYAEDRPFPDSSDEGEIRDKITKGERPAVSDVKHTIPEGLKGLLQTCWDHDPEKRPKMEKILKAVEDLEKQIENMSTTPSPPQPSPQPMHTDQPGMDDHEVEVPVSRGYSWEIVHPDEYIGESQVDPIANGVGGAAAVAAGSGIDATAIDFEASHNRTPISNAEWQIFAKILFLKKAFGLSETSAISKQVLLSGWFRKLKDSNWKADRERWFELTSTQIKYYADRIGDEDAPLPFGSRADPEKQKGNPIYLKGNTVVTKSTYTYTTLADPVENGVGSEGLFFLNTVQKEGRCLQIEQPNRSKKHSWRLVPIKEMEGSHETATQLDAWYDTISTLKRMEKLIELTWGCEEVRLGLQSEASTKSESKISFARLLKTFSILDESDLNEGGLVTPKWTYNRFQVFTFVRERELGSPSPRPQSPRPPRPQRALSRPLSDILTETGLSARPSSPRQRPQRSQTLPDTMASYARNQARTDVVNGTSEAGAAGITEFEEGIAQLNLLGVRTDPQTPTTLGTAAAKTRRESEGAAQKAIFKELDSESTTLQQEVASDESGVGGSGGGGGGAAAPNEPIDVPSSHQRQRVAVNIELPVLSGQDPTTPTGLDGIAFEEVLNHDLDSLDNILAIGKLAVDALPVLAEQATTLTSVAVALQHHQNTSASHASTSGNEERLAEMERKHKLSKACAICDTDIAEYTLIWEEVLRVEGAEISELETELESISARLPSDDPQQPTTLNGISITTSAKYLLELNLAFGKIDGILFTDVQRVVASLEILFKIGPAKKDERCIEKAKLSYDFDYSKLRDLRRASIVCPDIATVRTVCTCLDADPSVELLRVKNRFKRDYNAKNESAGYRDVQFNIKAVDPDTGIELVWELQVHLAAVEDLKRRLQGTADASSRTGHGRYVAFRTIVERL